METLRDTGIVREEADGYRLGRAKLKDKPMLKIILGLLLGLCIGIGCRWLDIPLPAPPNLMGAVIIVSITLGYVGTDYLLAQRKERGLPRFDRDFSTLQARIPCPGKGADD